MSLSLAQLRKALANVKRPSLIIVDEATVTEWAYSMGVPSLADPTVSGTVMGIPFIVRPGEALFAYPPEFGELHAP